MSNECEKEFLDKPAKLLNATGFKAKCSILKPSDGPSQSDWGYMTM